jgi:transposase
MVTIGVDPHKETHSAVAVDALGRQLSQCTEPAVQDGFGTLLVWARALDQEHVWVLEDCRHVSGPFERFLVDHGETVVRLPPRLMAGARDSVREPGKSDPIDALAIARAALREGIETLPTACLAGPELEIRLLCVHRQRLVDARTRLANQLRWELHALWPGWNASRARLRSATTQQQIARRLSRAEPTIRVRIARDIIRRIRDLTRTINALYRELADLVAKVAPQLLAEKGLGVRLPGSSWNFGDDPGNLGVCSLRVRDSDCPAERCCLLHGLLDPCRIERQLDAKGRCYSPSECDPTRHSAWPVDSSDSSRASVSDSPSRLRVSGTWLSSWWYTMRVEASAISPSAIRASRDPASPAAWRSASLCSTTRFITPNWRASLKS